MGFAVNLSETYVIYNILRQYVINILLQKHINVTNDIITSCQRKGNFLSMVYDTSILRERNDIINVNAGTYFFIFRATVNTSDRNG